MSLAEHVNTIPTSRMQCLTCIWLDTLPDGEREAFAQIAARVGPKPTDLSASQFYRWCCDEGLECNESSFKRHLAHGPR